MMHLEPSQQTHTGAESHLPDGDGYSAMWRQNAGKTTGNLGSAWGFLLTQG